MYVKQNKMIFFFNEHYANVQGKPLFQGYSQFFSFWVHFFVSLTLSKWNIVIQSVKKL